jgi:hypothetical protein
MVDGAYMRVYATFICKDDFRREVILDKLYPIYRLPIRVGNRLWMAMPENAPALAPEPREFYLESQKIIKNEYGTTARAIYREKWGAK